MPLVERLYLPLRPDQVRRLEESREIGPPLLGYRVTDDIRRARPAGDLEEWEFVALQQAARHAHETGAPVIVAAADVEVDHLSEDSAPGPSVEVVRAVTLPRVAALHVGDDVIGDRLVVDPDRQEIELSWYDTTELSHLVDLL
jgi:hypothetical protein